MPVRLVWTMMVVGAVMTVLVAASLVALAPAAPAQSELDEVRATIRTTTDRLEALVARLDETQQRGNELAGQYWQTESNLQVIDDQVDRAEADRTALEETRRGLRDEVRRVALDRYMARDMNLVWDDLDSIADREAAEALAALLVGNDQGALDRLAAVDAEHTAAVASLETQREAQQRTLNDVETTRAGIERELDELASLREVIADELAQLEAALARLEQAEAEREAARMASEEAARLADERRRAELAAAEAAARAAPAVPTPVPTPQATAAPTPLPTAVPSATATPTQTPVPTVQATAVPNPTPSAPFPTAVPSATATPTQTPVPTVQATAVPNPTPSAPFPTATAEPALPPTAVPNPQPPTPSTGGIVCPLRGPFTHIDDFNAPRAVGGIHRANDLIAATGTPVLAVASGTVEHRDSSVGGLSAHLRGDNGDYYFYTHLNGYENLGIGRVAAGTVIGYVGMTGNAPIPHLHFEIHRGGYGNYANPYGPVRAACGT